jgi:nicotinamide-nucleotide amidase
MIVEILAVGTELLLGQIVNSNATRIGERLADAGLDHFRQTVIGDNEERIAESVMAACGRSDALIVTGGLGPTRDDLTREALARAAGVPLVLDEEQARRLRDRWERNGRVMPESNLKQAERPEGADIVPNPKGTAPGIRMRIGDTWVFALPGVPAEMIPMIDNDVIPFLRGGDETVVASRLLRTWGEPESAIGERLADLYDASTNPTIAFLASAGEIKIRITAKAGTAREAEALIAPIETEVRERLGKRVFGTDGDTAEVIVLRMLEDRGWTFGTAESATGGLVAGRITSVPGASAVFKGSIVAYATILKESLLGVPDDVVSEYGVVSEPVAVAMAEGARRALAVDVAVSVTGSAGPDPQERPVGTVVIAVATPEVTRVRTLTLPGDRERIRTFATTAALQLTRMTLQGAAWGNR